jgi:hypothetical protein
MFDRQIFSALKDGVLSAPVFPLPVVNGQPPVVLVFDPAEPSIEIAFERQPTDGPRVRAATRESTLYWIPKLLPVFAVADGKVIHAREQTDGYAIVLEHRDGWATYYRRLEHMFVTPTDRRPGKETQVRAGDILGYVGRTKSGPLRPLHFELWRCNEDLDFEAIDPIRYITRWQLPRWNDAQLKSVLASHAPPHSS